MVPFAALRATEREGLTEKKNGASLQTGAVLVVTPGFAGPRGDQAVADGAAAWAAGLVCGIVTGTETGVAIAFGAGGIGTGATTCIGGAPAGFSTRFAVFQAASSDGLSLSALFTSASRAPTVFRAL